MFLPCPQHPAAKGLPSERRLKWEPAIVKEIFPVFNPGAACVADPRK
jgi:hypothetical protein